MENGISHLDYSRFVGPVSSRRPVYAMRRMATKYFAMPDRDEVIALFGGMPNPDTFPIIKANIELRDETTLEIMGDAMQNALQYQSTNGIQELVDRLRSIQTRVHSPPRKDWELVTTAGCQDGLCKAIDMLLAGEPEGEPVLVEEFVYAATVAMLEPYRPKCLNVPADEHGMRADKMREAILSCPPSRRPRFVYLNPTGANPTGKIISEQRKKEIYQVCSEFDILILEDDPYFFMQFDGRKEPSFFSMDTEGRVLRFDSFSKILSAGMRLGFASGPKPLIDRIVLHMQVTIVNASSLSQIIANELLKSWGEDGFFQHVDKVRGFYEQRRNAMVRAADKHLKDLCTWEVPAGGMFLWLDVPGVEDTWDMIMERALKKKVMLLPGKAFTTDSSRPCSHLRAAFSLAPEEKMDEAFRRLAELIKEEKKSFSK